MGGDDTAMKIKNWLRGVRTISLQAKALPGASILRTLIIRPPMISTLTILMLMILKLMISTHLISTLTIAWAWQWWQSSGKSIPAPRGSRGSLPAVARSASDPHPTPWQSWQSWQSFLKSILRVAVVAVVAQVDFATFYSTMTMLAVGLWQCGSRGSATNIA